MKARLPAAELVELQQMDQVFDIGSTIGRREGSLQQSTSIPYTDRHKRQKWIGFNVRLLYSHIEHRCFHLWLIRKWL